MKIEALTNVKHHPYYLTKGDVVTVDDESGAVMVKNGWAKNVDTGEQTAPAADTATLDIHGAGHTATDTQGK